MSKPVPPGEYLPAWRTSGSRPPGLTAVAMYESTDRAVASTLLLSPLSLAAVRIWASPDAWAQPLAANGWLIPRTIIRRAACADSTPVARVALSASSEAVVRAPVLLGQKFSGSVD